MPKISTTLTALTLTLALGLLAGPGSAQAGHKSNGHGKGGGYERQSSGHHKFKRNDDWDDRGGGQKHGHKKSHKKSHKKGHKYGHNQGHKFGHGHGQEHGHAKHHAAKRHGHKIFRGLGFVAHQFSRLQVAPHGNYGGCYKVSKVGYRHRQKALIGGTACYDRYGNVYVVDGSRYIIRYLNDRH